MSSRAETDTAEDGEVIENYIKNVRIVEYPFPDSEESYYQFEAPLHTEVTFENPELARLYADVYFDVNGFKEEGTGEHGVPPEIIQAGTDTLAAYLLTRPGIDINWISSFLGIERDKAERYIAWVRKRAAKIREGARAQGIE
ncbi:hypothetical protein [Natronococcus wangiae]|uniref:hypothetical protein n=1 Tax=Natronococcus wangiae TaxID=3068275 RepID=UPI00273EBD32|nr:hypothetical protein [Natronococcus sp. AD5]